MNIRQNERIVIIQQCLSEQPMVSFSLSDFEKISSSSSSNKNNNNYKGSVCSRDIMILKSIKEIKPAYTVAGQLSSSGWLVKSYNMNAPPVKSNSLNKWISLHRNAYDVTNGKGILEFKGVFPIDPSSCERHVLFGCVSFDMYQFLSDRWHLDCYLSQEDMVDCIYQLVSTLMILQTQANIRAIISLDTIYYTPTEGWMLSELTQSSEKQPPEISHTQNQYKEDVKQLGLVLIQIAFRMIFSDEEKHGEIHSMIFSKIKQRYGVAITEVLQEMVKPTRRNNFEELQKFIKQKFLVVEEAVKLHRQKRSKPDLSQSNPPHFCLQYSIYHVNNNDLQKKSQVRDSLNQEARQPVNQRCNTGDSSMQQRPEHKGTQAQGRLSNQFSKASSTKNSIQINQQNTPKSQRNYEDTSTQNTTKLIQLPLDTSPSQMGQQQRLDQQQDYDQDHDSDHLDILFQQIQGRGHEFIMGTNPYLSTFEDLGYGEGEEQDQLENQVIDENTIQEDNNELNLYQSKKFNLSSSKDHFIDQRTLFSFKFSKGCQIKFIFDKKKIKELKLISQGRMCSVFLCNVVNERNSCVVKQLKPRLNSEIYAILNVLDKYSKIDQTIPVERVLFCYLEPENEEYSILWVISSEKKQGFLNSENISKMTLKKKIEVAQTITSTLQILHYKEGIIHGALKSSNVLLDQKLDPCLSGFGFSELHKYRQTVTISGSPLYRSLSFASGYSSPESFNDQQVSKESDIWSLGMIFLKLFFGVNISGAIVREHKMYENGGFLKIQENQSSLRQIFVKLLREMTHFNPNSRCNLNYVLNQLKEAQVMLQIKSDWHQLKLVFPYKITIRPQFMATRRIDPNNKYNFENKKVTNLQKENAALNGQYLGNLLRGPSAKRVKSPEIVPRQIQVKQRLHTQSSTQIFPTKQISQYLQGQLLGRQVPNQQVFFQNGPTGRK